MKNETGGRHGSIHRAVVLAALVLGCLEALTAAVADLSTGYSATGLEFRGPGEWRRPGEAIWVYDYHTLRLRYRASGLEKTGAPVLTLRPGSIGPVTPGALNVENPEVAGLPVVVLTAADLVPDGKPHTLEIELRGKVRTPQIDQLEFSLPAGARLLVEDLQFAGDPDVFPCGQAGPALPANTERLAAQGPLACNGAPATALRDRGGILIRGNGRKGRTLYLSLMAHFAGIPPNTWGVTDGQWRARESKESSETAHVVARVKYADRSEEEQFPLLVEEGRHVLLNRKAALYAIIPDPSRPIASVELMDRSPHAQLVLFAAGLSQDAPPGIREEKLPPTPAAARRPAGEPALDGSNWYRLTTSAGKPVLREAVRADLRVATEPGGRSLSLTLTNVSAQAWELVLSFPSISVRPSNDPDDVYYLFPLQDSVISKTERKLEGLYSGRYPMQFLDVFAPAANRGVALVVRDTGGSRKRFRLRKSGAAVEAEVEYKVRLEPGQVFQPPDAQLVMHGGDWHEGFEAYRKWLKTWYTPKGPRPEWLRSAFWCRRDYPRGGTGRLFNARLNRYTFEESIRDGAAFGGIDIIDVSRWSQRLGEYPVDFSGPADLRRNIALAEKANVRTGLYFAPTSIDKYTGLGQRLGKQWQIVDIKGQGLMYAPNSTSIMVCPHIAAYREYFAGRVAAVAGELGAAAVYLDVYGAAGDARTCYSTLHGHPPGIETLRGEIAMAKEVRQRLDAAGLRKTIMYLEYHPPDVAAPYYDAALCYSLTFGNLRLSPLKLDLWRFAFPDIRLFDMLTLGIEPRVLSPEDFRLSLWHGNGAWLKGHSDTWYGDELLAFIRGARESLKRYAEAFGGEAEPLVASPHQDVFINRFCGGRQTVYTLFNASYRTVRFNFQGGERVLGPRAVEVVAGK